MAFQLGSFQSDAFQIGQIDWMTALSEPPANAAPRARVPYQQDLAFVSQYFQHISDENIGWFNPLSEPYDPARKPVAQQQELVSPVRFGANPDRDSVDWFRALSEPYEKVRRPVAWQQAYIAFDPEENETPGGADEALVWFSPLSEPYKKVRDPVAYQQSNIEVVPFELLSEGSIEWFRPFSEPYKKVRDPVVWQQSYIEPDVEETVEPGAGTEYDWFFALSEPAKFLERPRLDPSIQATYAIAFQKGDPFIYDYKNLFWMTAFHREQIDLVGKHLTGSSLIRLTASHSDSPTLTATHEATINKTAVNLVDGETDTTIGAFQVDAFWNRAFQTQQNFSNSLIVKVLTGKK